MPTVVGLDVCKSSVVAVVLTERPAEPRQSYFDYDFFKLSADAAGIKRLLSLAPDVAVLEPTGVNYSRLWVNQLALAGVEVRFVGHTQLRTYRVQLGLPDKDDEADALALGCYYFDYQHSDRRFVQVRDQTSAQIRFLVLRLSHLNRRQNPIINRIRQDLAWQFPEVANVKSRSNGEDVPLLWGWIAGERPAKRYDKLYAQTVGSGLSKLTRLDAQELCMLQRQERSLEAELIHLMEGDRRFTPYRKVFAQFGFGLRVSALLLSQIYPLENYFGPDGKPEVKIRKGRNSQKPTKRHLSLRRFCKALGVAPVREWSGDQKTKSKKAGSDLCRTALWQWCFTRIEVTKTRMKNDIGKILGEELDSQKSAGIPIKLVRSRICAKAVKMLFRALVQELHPNTEN